MNREEKTVVVQSLNKTFAESSSVILLSFKGVNVPDITELRRKVRDTGSNYRVIKNTLALRAAEGTAVQELREYLTGPTAIAYTSADPISLAKVLRDFVKSHPEISFKAGVLEGRVIDEGQVRALADMPSREELLGKLAYLLKAPLTRLATALQSPVRNLAVALSQTAGKKE